MTKLGSICSFQSGGTPAKGIQEYFNGSIPWITTTALNGAKIDEKNAVDWITEKAINETAAKIVPAYSIMVGTRVGVGKVAINTVNMSTSQDVISLLNIDERTWSKDYLCKFIQSKSSYLNSQARGATIKGIKIEVLSNLEVPTINIKHQQFISETLDRVRSVISTRKQELQKLDDLIKARFVEMFGDPILNSQHRPECSFIDVVMMKRGFDLPVQDRNQGGSIPVYGSNGPLDRHDTPKVQGGGVITGRSGTIGTVYYTSDDYWPLNTTLFSVDTHGNNIVYLAYLLKMYDLSRFTEGTGVPTLNRNKFHNEPIINVPLTEQERFAAFVAQIDKSKLVVNILIYLACALRMLKNFEHYSIA